MSILPHVSEALVHRHVILWDLLRHTLVVVIFASHGINWIYGKGGRPLWSFAKVEKCKGTGTVVSVDVFEARALSQYLSHRAKRWTPRDVQKTTTINRRRSATSLIPKRIQRWVTKDRRSKVSLNKGRVFRLSWIRLEV